MITVCKIGEKQGNVVYIVRFETTKELCRYFDEVSMNAMQPNFPVCKVKRAISSGDYVIHWMYSQNITDEYAYGPNEAIRAIENNTLPKKTTSEMFQELYDSAMNLGDAIMDDNYHESNKRFFTVIDMISALARELNVTIKTEDEEE